MGARALEGRKKIFFLSCFILLSLMVLLFTSSVFAAPKLKKTSLTLKKGNAYVLRLRGSDPDDEVTWKTSSKKKVAIVSGHYNRVVLQAKKNGKAVISCRIGGKTLKCKVTVKKNASYPSSLTLCEGDSFALRTSKKASWSLTSYSLGSLSARSGKKVTFTAQKTGKVQVIASGGGKTYACTVNVIRRDGASKEDLERMSAEVTDEQKGVFASLSASACGRHLGTDEIEPCNIHSMDLGSDTQAFMLYEYIYKYARAFDTQADRNIIDSDEYRYVSFSDLDALCTHLFGEEDLSQALSVFTGSYTDGYSSGRYAVYATGDFGDAGMYYFTEPDSITQENGMYCAQGRVMTYNSNMDSYIHTYEYRTYWYHRTQKRASGSGGTDNWFQFDHVEVF